MDALRFTIHSADQDQIANTTNLKGKRGKKDTVLVEERKEYKMEQHQ